MSPLAAQRFAALDALYREWNAKINVISRKDMDGLYEHHVLHSLSIAVYLKTVLPQEFARWAGGEVSVLDVGTGGGFPGIPLAILFPDTEFTLCDSVGKKTIVAGAVAKALELSNVRIVNDRAENLVQRYNYVVSRAVASLKDFYPWVRNSFTDRILYLRGGDIATEIGELAARFKLKTSGIGVWPVFGALSGEYFDEKWLVDIKKG
ncbi:MAG: 16S rRNA (guanine(527)-N(7))-methyltransferase RsmG [Bacteroidales bacterium]|nr:16S rRNA (guanine(527)-N(7))-methyltransferase RsmG [Bacteroidales bacterium]